jgi:hypothetical protein
MFKPTDSQLSLFQPDRLFPGILPSDDWSYVYREKIYPNINEDAFKHLYHATDGAPNKSIKKQISILIFMGIETLNWREAAFQFPRRIDWLNATYTPFGEANIDHTTLFKFYQRIEKDEAAYNLFRDLTGQFILECGVSSRRQRVDSFFMYGWLEKLSRYGLFKETIRSFLQNLCKNKPGLYDKISADLSRNYIEDNFDLTEKDKDQASRKILEMARDLYLLKQAFEKHKQIKHYKSFQTLAKVFEQQCLVKDAKSSTSDIQGIVESDSQSAVNTSHNVEIRKVPEGDKIISTPHNTDAEYTRKRDQRIVGHKGFLTETCGPENEVQFITDVNLETASHSDSEETLKIETRLEENGFKPESLYGDAGFVNGETILKSEDRDIDLEGPSSGRSQSFEKYESKNRPLDIADFKVDVIQYSKEIKVQSCPAGNEPLDQSRSKKTGKLLVHFPSEKCTKCELNEQCHVKIGVRKSTLTVDEKQHAGAVRHHKYMEDTDYRKECGIRAGAESLVNEVANGHGARQSRHRTESGSRLQLLFAALSCNIKRYIRHTTECVKKQAQRSEVMA